MSERLVVVPTDRHVERLVAAGVPAITRRALFERLELSLLPSTVLADPLETRMALAEALEQDGDRDAGDPSYLEAIGGALTVLRSASVDADALDRIGRSEGPVAARAVRLARAMRATDARLDRAGLLDARLARDRIATALAKLTGEEAAVAVGARELWCTWTVEWAAADSKVWRALDAALSRAGGRAHVEIASFERKLDAEREMDPLERVSDDLAQHLGEPAGQRPIAALLGDLTLTAPVPPEARTRLEIRTATDARAEAKAVVDAVAEALAQGVPIDRIAVAVLRSDDEPALARAASEADLPVYLGPCGATPESSLVAFAWSALELASRNLDRMHVAALLRSGYVDARALTGDDDRGRASRAKADLARALEATPTEPAPDPVAALEATARASFQATEALGALAREVGELLASVERPASRAEHAQKVRALFGRLGLPPRPDDSLLRTLSSDAKASGLAALDARSFLEDARAWQALENALVACERGAIHVSAEAPCSAAIFRHELGRALAVEMGRPRGARAGALRIVGLTELAAEELSLLCVMGATADALPESGDSGSFVTPALSQALRSNDPLSAPETRALLAARSMASLAWAVSAAERVVFSFRTRDDSGAAIAPSPVVAWLRRCGVTEKRFGAGLVGPRPWTARDRTLTLLALAPEQAESLAPDAVRRARVEGERQALHQGGTVGDWASVGRLPPSDALSAVLEIETGGGARPLGVTSLERFARCAFQGFSAAVLGAREEILAQDTPDRLEQGTFAHTLLEAAFEATRDEWPKRPRDAAAIVARGLAAVDALMDAKSNGLRRASMKSVRDEVGRVLEVTARDLSWDFAFAEQSFGSPDAWPALVLRDEATKLALAGTIDRVDVSHPPGAVRVVDYKRRSSHYAASDLGETLLQLPLYARVAARAAGAREATARYVLTVLPDAPPPPGWDERWASLGVTHEGVIDEHAAGIIRAVRRGIVLPRPRKDSLCETCGHEGICRRPRFAIPKTEGPVQ